MTNSRIYKRRDNVEFVQDLMHFSNYGPLAQMFVIECISKWSGLVANKSIEELRVLFGNNQMVSADTWHGVAKEINEKVEAQYNS